MTMRGCLLICRDLEVTVSQVHTATDIVGKCRHRGSFFTQTLARAHGQWVNNRNYKKNQHVNLSYYLNGKAKTRLKRRKKATGTYTRAKSEPRYKPAISQPPVAALSTVHIFELFHLAISQSLVFFLFR